MSLQDIYKKAGVVMKPAAMKDGKLYSQQPHSGAGDFNFSRADGVQTRINKHGLIETVANNEPRLSYDIVDGKVSDCPALLLEPSRTNDLHRTEEFDNSYWSKTNGTATANQTISPDGSQNADRFAENTTTSAHLISRNNIPIASGVSHTLSVFAKANGRNTFRLFADTSGNSFFAFFNLETKNIGTNQNLTGGAKIEEYPNDWYRCSITFTSTTASIYVQFLLSQDNEATSYSGDGSSGIYFYGAQLEQGGYATSYIPTSGSTEQRQADICNGSGNSETFNDSEGVLFAEISALTNDSGTYEVIQLRADSDNFLNVGYRDTSNNIYFYKEVGGVPHSPSLPSVSADILSNNKVAVYYSENTNDLWLNGVKVLSSTGLGSFANSLSSLNFDNNGTNNFYGKIKELTVINEALTDEQLQLLTTP